MSIAQVLVVEDNAATRKMMRVTLQAEGYSVLEAENGESALRLVAEHAPALILLDCKLPDMDGFEVARRLAKLAPTLPIVAVTGWARTEEVVTPLFVNVLVKPVDLSSLVEVVERGVEVGGCKSRTFLADQRQDVFARRARWRSRGCGAGVVAA